MKSIHFNSLTIAILTLFIISCEDDTTSSEISYDKWTVTGDGLDEPTTKNVLTEFAGSTNCPYCPESDELLLSYFNSEHENYVGSSITNKWFLINYHTYSPGRGDPMYEFLRGAAAEDDFCYVRFEEGSWYTIYGVPTTFTNGSASAIYTEMASSLMSNTTPLQISLNGTAFDGAEVEVQIAISSSRDISTSDSLHLFLAATIDNVEYTGYNGEPIHQDVFLGWINEGFNGELLSIGNETITKKYTWTFPANWPQNNYETTWSQVEYDVSDIGIVAFVQNKYTKEILQVAGKN